MIWIVNDTINNKMTWCADGSYTIKHALGVSSTRWTVYCTTTDERLVGNLFDVSDDTGPYS